MKKIRAYISNSYDELVHKVSWPGWEELRDSTLIVLVASFIFAIIVYVADFGISEGLKAFYSIFK